MDYLYISAQPDETLFIWQLKLLLMSMKKIDVQKENIHILIGYNSEDGPSAEALSFRDEYREIACVFFYKDDRKNIGYVSSIRPHILRKHFLVYKNLESRVLIYHDSDILFLKKLPQRLIKGSEWYVSDTNLYLNYSYIKNNSKTGLFTNFCQIVGVAPNVVIENDNNTGGAQYIMKNVTYKFWEKVEKDSSDIYTFLILEEEKSKKNKIQAWCADMWALLWNAYFFNHKVNVVKEMDFCWPNQGIDSFSEYYIYHDAGAPNVVNPKIFFYKHLFKNITPFFIDFNNISQEYCSKEYVKFIEEVQSQRKKYSLVDTSFIIIVDNRDHEQIKYLTYLIEKLGHFFLTNLLIFEVGSFVTLNDIASKSEQINIHHTFIDISNSSRIDRTLIHDSKIEYLKVYGKSNLVFFKLGLYLNPEQVIHGVTELRYSKYEFIIPHSGYIIKTDNHELYMDYDEYSPINSPSTNACIDHDFFIIKKDVYIQHGEDIEVQGLSTINKIRYKRYESLGISCKYLKHPLFYNYLTPPSILDHSSNIDIYLNFFK